MANKKIIKTIFQLRRATFDEWEANRPITPAEGEPCFIIDQNILKIGDGKTEFGDLEPINGVNVEIAADEKSIVVEDNIFKLFGFSDAEVGAQPRKTADGIIEWVVPADVTGFDEIKEDVAALKEDVSELETNVKTLQDIVGATEGENPLVERVASVESAIGILNSEATVEGSVKQIVTDEINKFATEVNENGAIDKFAELVQYVADHEGAALDMAADIVDLQAKIGATTVEAQIKAALEAGNFASADKVGSLQDIVDGISASYLSEEKAKVVFEKVKYEVSNKPVGALVDYREKEIRVMVPADTKWVLQESGENANANMYYIGFKAYAPEGAVSFKEDTSEIITDDTMHYFENNDFAGIDMYGRKYSVIWLPVAVYDEASAVWTYYGANSSAEHYIGWYYSVEWYGADGIKISSDCIRINLSNETCHSNIKPFYMEGVTSNAIEGAKIGDTVLDIVDKQITIPIGAGLKSSDEIEIEPDGTLRIKVMSWDKLIDGETEIVMDGGSAVK